MLSALVCAVFVVGASPALAQTPPPTAPPPATTQVPPAKPAAPTAKPAPPAPAPFPPGATVAFVNLQFVVNDSKLGKQGQDQLKALQDKLSTQIATKNKDIQALQDKMKQQANVVSQAVLDGMARDVDRLQREAQFMAQNAQAESDAMSQQLLKDFQEKVVPVIEAVRAEKGLFIIFAVGGDNTSILAAHAGLDLTAEIVKRLDATVK
jgi:outer membrane protein